MSDTFTGPVNIDFAPTVAYSVDDLATLGYLIGKLIEEDRAFFCRPDTNGWTVVASAPAGDKPSVLSAPANNFVN